MKDPADIFRKVIKKLWAALATKSKANSKVVRVLPADAIQIPSVRMEG